MYDAVFFSSLTSYYNHTHWMGILWYKVVHVTTLETLKTRCWDSAYSSSSQNVVPRPLQGHHNFTMTLGQMNTCLLNSHSFPSWRPHHFLSLNRLQEQIGESRYLLLSQKLKNCKNIKQHHSLHQIYF